MASVQTPFLGAIPENVNTKTPGSHVVELPWWKRARSNPPKSTWKPNAYRLLPLAAVIAASWALIVVLQLLLTKSQKEGGIIIAEAIDDIPLSTSFLYLYLPTVIALVFGIFWGWIDLQVKRLEPYHQLSKPDGAWGKDSLLLSYPFDFLPLVPVSALKKKHWAVFWASTCVVFVTWGVVPFQAGIFSSETIRLSSTIGFSHTTGFIPASEQSDKVDARYIHSAHGIIWLNETLPPYMTRDYTLTPFEPEIAELGRKGNHRTWTSTSTLYSLDMNCEKPGVSSKAEQQSSDGSDSTTVRNSQWTSSDGCAFPTSYYTPIGNETLGPKKYFNNSKSIWVTKEYASVYIGFYPTDNADYYLKTYCPQNANHTFMAWFTKNKQRDEDPPNEVTRLYCTPFYYEQEVVATIDAKTRAPINITTTSGKRALPAEKWNSTYFEQQMNTGQLNEFIRGALPLDKWPDQLETISTHPVSLINFATDIQPMAGYIIGASQRPLEELLDSRALAAAYESVYRIVFARSMVQILDQDFTTTFNSSGRYDYEAAAIVVVPVFTYIVEGLLGFVSVCGIILLLISLKLTWKIRSDPATIASIQSLVADNTTLLQEFSALDRASMDEIETSLKDKKFKLDCDQEGVVIIEADSFDTVRNHAHGAVQIESEESQMVKPVRPKEFRAFMILLFLLLQVALAAVLGVLLHKSQPFGIVRPSTNPLVRQLLENYIPTALATLIEPIWILVNRLLCMLQPLEELRGGHAAASRSIEADYSSLPPQLVIFKALKSSHFKLAAVCTMALLANFLAVAFSGMFHESSVLVPRNVQLVPPYQAKFVDVNGTVGPGDTSRDMEQNPSGAYTGGSGYDQFMVAESNYTTGNPLPAWTDNEFMYIPFMNETKYNGSEGVKGQTTAFGSTLECKTIPDTDFHVNLRSSITDTYANISITMLDDLSGEHVTCSTRLTVERGPAPTLGLPPVCGSGRLAMEFVLRFPSQSNATRAERDFCQQTAFLGYVRGENSWCIPEKNGTTTLDDSTAVFIGCRAKLVAGQANVRVDKNGRVENVTDLDVSSTLSSDFYNQHFTNSTSGPTTAGGADDLIAQAHRYLFQSQGRRYHNDSFATDFMNYFMIKQTNDSRLLDPNSPLPSLEDITGKLYPVYKKLFAIWLGINKDKLLVPWNDASVPAIQGQTNELQTRIFLSMPLFVMAEVILALYAIVAICIYLWRPGKFLPRMPISIGAIIALFAASEAVQDMRGTSLFTKKERGQHLERLGRMYGYGSFAGTDGKPHEGIEKEPLVNAVPLLGVMKKVQIGFSEKSLGLRRGKAH
ncbi:uncharacterized protein EKO05_0009920 [Ascochyta rabiei]|uniref:Uncharacterized protein n=1 Tax=Didymella rabiei TaxID=5454 RepID=A0A163MH02_DIDRA|nr:uncharacterized protein EKO05_0009920 [Ascochyta rabiei]KZM28707.1 hypothetical protein ST47_g164 [Ascochyta rabiei]UPX19665.1 hypothetical protein EKO05_0009920 [Ascochyta rabiei]